MTMQRTLLITVGIALLVGTVALGLSRETNLSLPTQTATVATTSAAGVFDRTDIILIDGKEVVVSIARTAAERQQGLSDTPVFPPDRDGLLFVFSEPDIKRFWMKGMHYAIDILWFTADGTLVSVTHDLSPDTFPQSFGPDEPVQYVLETPVGWAAAKGIEEGDRLLLPPALAADVAQTAE